MPGPRVAVGFIGDKNQPGACTLTPCLISPPSATRLRQPWAEAPPVSLLASLLVGEVVHA